jgi:hypothetical protein
MAYCRGRSGVNAFFCSKLNKYPKKVEKKRKKLLKNLTRNV